MSAEAPPEFPARGIDRLLHVVDRLRGEGGCPWDRKQTLPSLRQYLVEECYEVLDALDAGNPDEHAEELGDVLLQIAMQARLRQEEQAFTFDEVARRAADKLIRRHPHVFGDRQVADADDVLRNWEALKSAEAEEGRRSALEGVPRHLPALQKAQRVQSRAARVGFDWTRVSDVLAKVQEELDETRQAIAAGDAAHVREEIGDLLFAVVNLCRFQATEAEEALRATVAKFIRRFQSVEQQAWQEGKDVSDCPLAVLDAHWEAAKAAE